MCGRFVSISQRAFTHVQTALGLVNAATEEWPAQKRDLSPEGAKAWLESETSRPALESLCVPALRAYEHRVTTLEDELALLSDS